MFTNKMESRIIGNVILGTLLLFSAVSQPAIASNCDKHSMSIAGQAANAGIFNTLLAAAKATNLTDALYNDGLFTIFAPTDEAFNKLPDGKVESLLKNPIELTKVLKYHLVKGTIFSRDLNDGSSVLTMLVSPVSINNSDGVLVNNAKVLTADLEATNGVTHVIDKVLLPTT